MVLLERLTVDDHQPMGMLLGLLRLVAVVQGCSGRQLAAVSPPRPAFARGISPLTNGSLLSKLLLPLV